MSIRKRISLYIWCRGTEQRRHIAVCMREECACDKFRSKIEEVRKREEKRQMTRFNIEVEGDYRWDSENLFQTQKI